MDDLNKAFNLLFGFKVPIDDYDELKKKVEEARELKEYLNKVELLKDMPQIITPVKMTNYDRIKSMSVEEMAKIICKSENCEKVCAFTKDGKCNSVGTDTSICIKGCKQWLLQEVEENDR